MPHDRCPQVVQAEWAVEQKDHAVCVSISFNELRNDDAVIRADYRQAVAAGIDTL